MVRFLALISVLLMLKFFSLVNWIKDLAVKIASKIEFEGRIPSFTWDSNKQWKTATSSPEASHHQTLESFVYFNYKQESFPSCHFQLLLWVSNVFTSWFHWLRFAVEGWSLFFLYKTAVLQGIEGWERQNQMGTYICWGNLVSCVVSLQCRSMALQNQLSATKDGLIPCDGGIVYS